MADARIFAKTPKGSAEVGARSGALSPAQRRVLILVDGVRNVDQLARMLPGGIEQSLQALQDSGHVVLLGQAAAAESGEPLLPPVSIPESEMTSVHEAKLRAVRALNALLGPAADALAIAIEGAANGDELRPLVREAELLIASAHGAAAARTFILGIRRR